MMTSQKIPQSDQVTSASAKNTSLEADLNSCDSNLASTFQTQMEKRKFAAIESPAEAAQRAERVAVREAVEKSQRRGNAISALRSQVGIRYSKCTLQGFNLAEDGDIRREQETVLSRMTAYRD